MFGLLLDEAVDAEDVLLREAESLDRLLMSLAQDGSFGVQLHSASRTGWVFLDGITPDQVLVNSHLGSHKWSIFVTNGTGAVFDISQIHVELPADLVIMRRHQRGSVL